MQLWDDYHTGRAKELGNPVAYLDWTPDFRIDWRAHGWFDLLDKRPEGHLELQYHVHAHTLPQGCGGARSSDG